MMIPRSAFNFFLLMALALSLGCKTAEEKEKANRATSLRLHLETNVDGTPYNHPVPIYRENPILVNVKDAAVLDEAFMREAQVIDVDELGGWGIKIVFDATGTRRLQHITTANKGRRMAIYAHWEDPRWLAAPLITRNITNGVFIFTPDASREEAEEIVEGLNNVIEKLKKPYVF